MRHGRHQDYFTTPVVSQTSLFRHPQICILALLCQSVDTQAGFLRAEWCLGGSMEHFPGLGGAGITKRRESKPEEHSCISISTFSICKSLSTNHLSMWTNRPDSKDTILRGVRKEEGLSSLHPWPSLPIPHLSALAWKILRVYAKAEAWGSQWSQIMAKDLDLGSYW